MYQLIINTNTENKNNPELDSWEEVDLGTATVALTYQANDLGELKSREVNRSNRIKLPRTARNNRLFGLPSEPLSATVTPYRYFDCRLYDDGVELFGAGAKLQLMDTTSTTYEVCIKGSLFDFFENIKSLSIRDIDTKAYNTAYPDNPIDYTPWTVAAVANTNEDNTVVFPLIDWDTANNANLTFGQPGLEEESEEVNEESYRIHIKSQYIFPAVKLSALMEAMCMAQGYQLQLPPDVTNDPEQKYKQAVVPVCSLHPGEDKLNEIKSEMYILAGSMASGAPAPYKSGKFFLFTPSSRNNIAPIDGDQSNPCYMYIARYSGTYTFNIMATPTEGYNPNAALYIKYDAISPKGEKEVTEAAAIPLNGDTHLLTIDIQANGYLRFWVEGGNSAAASLNLKSFLFTCIAFKPIGAVFPTDKFPVLKNMPDITQLDLFKAVCQLYGLMVSVDEGNKHIEAYTFNDVVANITNNGYVDWSHKLDDTSHSSTYQWSSYGQRNYITYAEEEGKDGEKLQDRAHFTIDNHTLPTEKTLFELPFATCEETKVCGHTMAKIRMVEEGDSSPDSITEPKPKLLYVQKKDGVKVRFLDPNDSKGDIDNTTIILTNFNSLKTKSFVDEYYTVLSKHLLPRIRVLKEKLWLTPIDMQKFTHQKPVYLSKYNCCFYVNKINNYQPNKLTEVELVTISL